MACDILTMTYDEIPSYCFMPYYNRLRILDSRTYAPGRRRAAWEDIILYI